MNFKFSYKKNTKLCYERVITLYDRHSRFSHDAAVFQYQKMNRDQTELRQRMFEVVNFVNMVSQFPFYEFWGNFQTLENSEKWRAEWMFPFSRSVWMFLQGLQVSEDLRRPGGSGDLVQWGPDLRDPPGRLQPGRVHEVEKL